VVERVDLVHEHGKAVHQRWHHGWELGWNATYVAVGQLADGRWFADRVGRGASRRDKREGACVYAGPHAEWYARRTAGCWMRALGGTWAEA
jgi:hypothetical protein